MTYCIAGQAQADMIHDCGCSMDMTGFVDVTGFNDHTMQIWLDNTALHTAPPCKTQLLTATLRWNTYDACKVLPWHTNTDHGIYVLTKGSYS